MTPDEFKTLIDQIGNLINKRAETTELTIKGHVSKEVSAAEERIIEELRGEILAARAEAKADILSLEAKLLRKVQRHERHIDNLEKATNTPDPDKN